MINHLGSNGRMSQIVHYPLSGRQIVLAGQVSSKPDANVGEQTQDVLGKVDALLAEVGCDRSDLTQVTIWLADIGAFVEMNTVYDAWVVPDRAPVRACVEARLADPRLLVEIQAIAVKF